MGLLEQLPGLEVAIPRIIFILFDCLLAQVDLRRGLMYRSPEVCRLATETAGIQQAPPRWGQTKEEV